MSQINPKIYDKINIEEHNSNTQLQLNITNNQVLSWNKEIRGNYKFYVEIYFYCKNEMIDYLKIPIKVEKKFSNNKIFY